MTFLQALLLGVIQGITEFLPVSSSGHLSLLENWMGLERSTGLLPEAMMHLGTAAAVVLVFRRDILRILREYAAMAVDLVGNLHIYVHNARSQEQDLPYARIVSGTYRTLAALVLVATIPTAILGYTARRLVTMAAISPFLPGAFTIITGMFLLVTDLSRMGEKRSPREAGYDAALWLGVTQGLAVFPGISRSGLTICSGLLCGLRKRFLIKFTYIMSIPACIGAFFVEAGNLSSPALDASGIFMLVVSAAAAAATGYFLLKLLLRLTNTIRLSGFAYYNFLIGILMLVKGFS